MAERLVALLAATFVAALLSACSSTAPVSQNGSTTTLGNTEVRTGGSARVDFVYVN